jgi:methyl-accepting chemotaxis protein
MLNNMSVGKKIALGFGTCIAITVLVAGAAWFGLGTASDGFTNYREIARDNVLMGRVQANLLEARLQVKNFIQTDEQSAVEKFNERFKQVGEFIKEAEKSIQNPTRAQMVREIKSNYTSYNDAFKKVVAAQAQRDDAVKNGMDPSGLAMRQRLTEIMESAYRDNDQEAVYFAGRIQEHVILSRLYAMKFLDTNAKEDAARAKKELTENVSKLDKDLNQSINNPRRRALLAEYESARTKYLESFDRAVSVINSRNQLIADKLDTIGPEIAAKAEEIKLSLKEEQDTIGPTVQASNERTSTITVVVAIVGVVIAIFLGFFISGRITRPISMLKDAAIEVSKGDLDQTINLDQRDEVGQLADAFKEMVSNLKDNQEAEAENKKMVDGVIAAVASTASDLQEGRLSSRATSANATGAYREMIDKFNGALEAVINPLNVSANYLERISNGDIPSALKDQYKGDFKNIADSINRCIDALSTLISKMNYMSTEHDRGDIDVTIPPDKFEGAFRQMAEGVNHMVGGHINDKKKAMACVKEFGFGNFDAPLERFPGKKAFINETIEGVRTNLKELNNELTNLINASREGRLSERGDATRFNGGWAALVTGVNDIIGAIMDPINEAGAVLDQLSNYDLTARVLGNYQVDHARIKEALNNTAEALHDSISQVSEAIEQVSSASHQIASSSQQVAEGASEQASSLEETSSSLEEMSGMTKQNADNTQQAKGIAEETRSAADKGSDAMDKMMTAMERIKSAAEGTAEIIKDINDIAFQTNLLALNAAVEAARAGDAGRGFAVVAEEVRNLAGRAKEAAKNTEALIKESVTLADQGQSISGEVAGNLQDIVTSVGKVTSLVGEINVASQEQARGIEQVNRAVNEMDRVVQQAAANAEESSSAAEELASQSSELSSMVQRFSIETKHTSSKTRLAPQHVTSKKAAQAAGSKNTANQEMAINPENLIPMETDGDFAQF